MEDLNEYVSLATLMNLLDRELYYSIKHTIEEPSNLVLVRKQFGVFMLTIDEFKMLEAENPAIETHGGLVVPWAKGGNVVCRRDLIDTYTGSVYRADHLVDPGAFPRIRDDRETWELAFFGVMPKKRDIGLIPWSTLAKEWIAQG